MASYGVSADVSADTKFFNNTEDVRQMQLTIQPTAQHIPDT